MIEDITLPSFGSSVGEATIVQWLVEPGSAVSAGEVIAEIETDKAMAELEAPADGVIDSVEVHAGIEGVEVGTVLARLRTEGELRGEEASVPTAAGEAAERSPVAPLDEPATKTRPASRAGDDERVLASPYARKLASESGLALEGVAGSGPEGRIVSRDLEQLAPAQANEGLAAHGFAPEHYELQPASRMRRAIADGLVRSVREIPHYALTVDLDFGAVRDHRAAWEVPSTRPSYNDYVVWACARALLDEPAANASWTPDGIARHVRANIAVAVALDDGLVTPVIHDAGVRDLADIALSTREAVDRARKGPLNAGELQGATFTVSNLGMMGIRSFTSILSAPQACILSVGMLEERPVVENGEITTAHLATCTLTCDHRVVDGAVGARFLQRLRERLEKPGN